jgi:hypothetical protein
MQRHVVIVVSAVLLAVAVGSAAFVAQASNGSSRHKGGHGPRADRFVGYWMGIDPLDGGDSRRGITPNKDRTFSLIGRDTVFTLCDDTDRAIVTDGALTPAGSALVSDDFVITCTNTGSTVRLKVRYDVIDRAIIRETLVTLDGEPVDEIILHRVSER